MLKPTDHTIDDYIVRFPPDVQEILQQIRTVIHEVAPEAIETISYQMPAFTQQGILVYFAAWKKHIGLYPPVSNDAEFTDELAVYAGPKGNLQFPLDQPMPFDLIRKIVQFRLQENLARAEAKRSKMKK